MDAKWEKVDDSFTFGVGLFVNRAIIVAFFVFFILGFGLLGNKLLALQRPAASGKPYTTDYFPTKYHSRDCSLCHSVEGNKLLPKLKKAIPQICLECHLKEQHQMNDSSKHPLFAQGRCSDCHRIHTPLYEHLLKEDLQVLCSSCHNVVAQLIAKDAHRGLSQDSAPCLVCHFNHSSSNNSLLRADAVSLCQSCHNLGEKIRNHPVGDDYIDPRTGGALTCTSSCHNPHGSRFKPMLQRENRDGFCLSCHNMSLI